MKLREHILDEYDVKVVGPEAEVEDYLRDWGRLHQRANHLEHLIWRAKAHCPADLFEAMRESIEAITRGPTSPKPEKE